jgi:hypothetical protein
VVDQSRRNSRTSWSRYSGGPYAGNDLSSQGPDTATPPTNPRIIQSFQTASEGNGHPSHQGSFDPHHASVGQLVSQAAGQISTLVRSELALGRSELLDKGKKFGLGGAMLAVAGVLSLFALGLVLTLFVVILDLSWPLWLAVLVPLLVVGVLTLGIAGLGVNRLRKGASAPTQAANSVRDDIRSMKHAFQEGRHNGHHGHAGHNGQSAYQSTRYSEGRQ